MERKGEKENNTHKRRKRGEKKKWTRWLVGEEGRERVKMTKGGEEEEEEKPLSSTTCKSSGFNSYEKEERN
jgi:hypothetical protein